MRNRTADLLLTMETLCLLSYRGQTAENNLQQVRAVPQIGAARTPGRPEAPRPGISRALWQVKDSNLRRHCRRFYRPLPLATRASCHRCGPARNDDSRMAGLGKTRPAVVGARMGPDSPRFPELRAGTVPATAFRRPLAPWLRPVQGWPPPAAGQGDGEQMLARLEHGIR